MNGMVDLHIHTTASDGTCTPTEVVRLAGQQGLSVIAVTDHDTMRGVEEAIREGEKLGIEVIPGVEFSSDYRGRDTHVLGYGLDSAAPALDNALAWMIHSREARNSRIVELMRADGIDISAEELRKRYPNATIGRPHLAQILVEQGRADSVSDAFARFLNKGRPYYLPRTYLPFSDAVQTVLNCGGIPVLAHPLQYRYSAADLHTLVETAVMCGVQGIEVYYTGYDSEQRRQLLLLAEEFGLFATGGSDFHGGNKPDICIGIGRGGLLVPQTCAESLHRAMAKTREMSTEKN